jgi:3-oxoacyl-ACP reductase-like protein
MGIFSSIHNAIFGHAKAAESPQPATPSAPTSAGAAPAAAPSPGAAPAPTAAPASAAPAPAAASAPVDVAAVLDQAVKASGQKLDWKHSIVDMLKALNLDSSHAARKELATELGYKGDMSDSAAMNVWLHKAVMAKLAANGGKVPAELKD